MFCLSIFDWAESSLLRVGFLCWQQAGATLWLQHLSSRACEVSNCSTQAWLPNSLWNLPGPGIEPMSPALAGGFLTTGPPGKSQTIFPILDVLDLCCALMWDCRADGHRVLSLLTSLLNHICILFPALYSSLCTSTNSFIAWLPWSSHQLPVQWRGQQWTVEAPLILWAWSPWMVPSAPLYTYPLIYQYPTSLPRYCQIPLPPEIELSLDRNISSCRSVWNSQAAIHMLPDAVLIWVLRASWCSANAFLK